MRASQPHPSPRPIVSFRGPIIPISPVTIIEIFAAIVAAWALLSVLGGERQRRMQVIEVARQVAERAAIEAANRAVSQAASPAVKHSSR